MTVLQVDVLSVDTVDKPLDSVRKTLQGEIDDQLSKIEADGRMITGISMIPVVLPYKVRKDGKAREIVDRGILVLIAHREI